MTASALTDRLSRYASSRVYDGPDTLVAEAMRSGIYLAILTDPTVRPAVEAYLNFMEAADSVRAALETAS